MALNFFFPAICEAVVLASAFAQSQAEPPSNISCVKRLEIPEYAVLPRQARIQAVERVLIVLTDKGSVDKIETEVQNSKLIDLVKSSFSSAAEKAIRRSLFDPNCGGQTITLVFHFVLAEDGIHDSFAFTYPNHFWIKAAPQLMMPETTEPQSKESKPRTLR